MVFGAQAKGGIVVSYLYMTGYGFYNFFAAYKNPLGYIFSNKEKIENA